MNASDYYIFNEQNNKESGNLNDNFGKLYFHPIPNEINLKRIDKKPSLISISQSKKNSSPFDSLAQLKVKSSENKPQKEDSYIDGQLKTLYNKSNENLNQKFHEIKRKLSTTKSCANDDSITSEKIKVNHSYSYKLRLNSLNMNNDIVNPINSEKSKEIGYNLSKNSSVVEIIRPNNEFENQNSYNQNPIRHYDSNDSLDNFHFIKLKDKQSEAQAKFPQDQKKSKWVQNYNSYQTQLSSQDIEIEHQKPNNIIENHSETDNNHFNLEKPLDFNQTVGEQDFHSLTPYLGNTQSINSLDKPELDFESRCAREEEKIQNILKNIKSKRHDDFHTLNELDLDFKSNDRRKKINHNVLEDSKRVEIESSNEFDLDFESKSNHESESIHDVLDFDSLNEPKLDFESRCALEKEKIGKILKNIKSERVKNSIEKCIQKRLKIAFSTLKWFPGFHLIIPPDSLESIDREYSVNQSKKIDNKDFCESCGHNLEHNPIFESFSKMHLCMNIFVKLSLKTVRYAFFHIKSFQRSNFRDKSYNKSLQEKEIKITRNQINSIQGILKIEYFFKSKIQNSVIKSFCHWKKLVSLLIQAEDNLKNFENLNKILLDEKRKFFEIIEKEKAKSTKLQQELSDSRDFSNSKFYSTHENEEKYPQSYLETRRTNSTHNLSSHQDKNLNSTRSKYAKNFNNLHFLLKRAHKDEDSSRNGNGITTELTSQTDSPNRFFDTSTTSDFSPPQKGPKETTPIQLETAKFKNLYRDVSAPNLIKQTNLKSCDSGIPKSVLLNKHEKIVYQPEANLEKNISKINPHQSKSSLLQKDRAKTEEDIDISFSFNEIDHPNNISNFFPEDIQNEIDYSKTSNPDQSMREFCSNINSTRLTNIELLNPASSKTFFQDERFDSIISKASIDDGEVFEILRNIIPIIFEGATKRMFSSITYNGNNVDGLRCGMKNILYDTILNLLDKIVFIQNRKAERKKALLAKYRK